MKTIILLATIFWLFDFGVAVPVIENRNELSERASSTCVLFDGDINTSSDCDSEIYTKANTCTVISPTSSLSSVMISGDMRCTLFSTADCSGEDLVIPWDTLALSKVGWVGRAKSLLCEHSAKTSSIADEWSHALIGNSSDITSKDLELRDLGTCIDICDNVDGTGTCFRNRCSPPGLCLWVTFGMKVESLEYKGATHCTIWSNYGCNGANWALPFALQSLTPFGWGGGRMKSIACWRPF
jgi:hypothetical protein